jgi:hypothetical protein
MAFVQIAHGGHKGRAMGLAQVLAQFFDGSDNVHGVEIDQTAPGVASITKRAARCLGSYRF